MPRWLLLACAMALVSCGEPQSRTFAVTVTDSPILDCTGHANGLLADPEQLDELAKDVRKAWKKAYAEQPPRPQGRMLRVNELDQRMQAWFEGASYPAPSVPSPWEDAGAPEEPQDEVEVTEPPFFDDPRVVYQGDVQEDYIEGTFTDSFNTDEADEEDGRRPCGERHRARGTLSLTTSGGLAGRVRWTEITYIASEFSACEGRVECARDIAVEGLEAE